MLMGQDSGASRVVPGAPQTRVETNRGAPPGGIPPRREGEGEVVRSEEGPSGRPCARKLRDGRAMIARGHGPAAVPSSRGRAPTPGLPPAVAGGGGVGMGGKGFGFNGAPASEPGRAVTVALWN